MKKERMELISKLAKEVEKNRVHFEMLGYRNIQTDPEKRNQQVVDYALARAELYDAQSALDKAIRDGN